MMRIISIALVCAAGTCTTGMAGEVVRGGPYVDRSAPLPPVASRSMLDMPLPPPVPHASVVRGGVSASTGLDPNKLHVVGITGRRVLLRYERDGSTNNDIGTMSRSATSDSNSGGQLRVQRGTTMMVRHGEPVFLGGQTYQVNVADDTVSLYSVQGKNRDLVWSGQIEGQPYTDVGPSTQTFTPPLSVGAEFTKEASSNGGSSPGQSYGSGGAGASAPGLPGSTNKR